jgi:hypothetical protein
MFRAGTLTLALFVAMAATASAQPSLQPWDGSNPFNCELQQAGLEAVGPDPAADPYCVEFDKTRQNVTQLGILDFALKEPARVAAALPKCFYYQADHWRGSIVQDDDRTELYEFQGRYFFDKARGEGGAYFVEVGMGGRIVWSRGFQVPADPRCAERAERDPDSVYAKPRCDRRGGHTSGGSRVPKKRGRDRRTHDHSSRRRRCRPDPDSESRPSGPRAPATLPRGGRSRGT